MQLKNVKVKEVLANVRIRELFSSIDADFYIGNVELKGM